MTKEAIALITLIDSMSTEVQREVIRALWKRFADIIEEEEDSRLLEEETQAYEEWVKTGKKTVPLEKIKEELEKDGTL